MRTNSLMKIALPLFAVLILLAGGCNGAVDDPDANVILEVVVTESPAITGQDDGSGGCMFTITEWSADFLNQPKNDSATTSPYNDIIIRSWIVSYSWPGNAGIIPPPDRLLPSPGTDSGQRPAVGHLQPDPVRRPGRQLGRYFGDPDLDGGRGYRKRRTDQFDHHWNNWISSPAADLFPAPQGLYFAPSRPYNDISGAGGFCLCGLKMGNSRVQHPDPRQDSGGAG